MSDEKKSLRQPYFAAGIALLGSGVALVSTSGSSGIGLLAVGLVFMVISVRAGRVKSQKAEEDHP